ncbi:MAG TPA: gamma-glutamyltransferase [Polyangiaceae bacterium]|nr:gamma-glutamyltransferase [Polyangiaceae bacterium]
MSKAPSGSPRDARRRLLTAFGLLPVVLGMGVALPAIGAPSATATAPFAVATESPTATRQAARLLEAGGNAFDAAVLAALISGYTNPSSSGIGGGGFALVFSARDKESSILDFRETAPSGIDAALLDKRPVPEDRRGQLVGVPGEVAGLFELHRRWGKLKWRDVVDRAARMARQGFVAEPHTVDQIATQQKSPLARSATYRSVYLPQGKPPTAGQTLRSAKLATTLRRIAGEGRRGFYEGTVASDMVKAVQAAGGSLALADLSSYQPLPRQPLRVEWDGKQVLTMPPPSAGGLLVTQVLALFNRAELTALQQTPAKRLHLLAEAMRAAFADRVRYIGDPAFVRADIAKLLAPARMASRKQRLAEDRTHTQPRFGLEESGTHHLITVDAEGNWVSLTTTVNAPFGAKIVAEQSGVILNDELGDFATRESIAVFGLSEGPNRPRPGARPVSSMAPTLVLENGVPIAALGGSGGTSIAPNVAQVLLDRLVAGTAPEAALSAARFTIPSPSSGNTLSLEASLAKLYGPDLEQRGELLTTRDWKNSVQLVVRENGRLLAAADPRKQGAAEAHNPAQ